MELLISFLINHNSSVQTRTIYLFRPSRITDNNAKTTGAETQKGAATVGSKAPALNNKNNKNNNNSPPPPIAEFPGTMARIQNGQKESIGTGKFKKIMIMMMTVTVTVTMTLPNLSANSLLSMAQFATTKISSKMPQQQPQTDRMMCQLNWANWTAYLSTAAAVKMTRTAKRGPMQDDDWHLKLLKMLPSLVKKMPSSLLKKLPSLAKSAMKRLRRPKPTKAPKPLVAALNHWRPLPSRQTVPTPRPYYYNYSNRNGGSRQNGGRGSGGYGGNGHWSSRRSKYG